MLKVPASVVVNGTIINNERGKMLRSCKFEGCKKRAVERYSSAKDLIYSSSDNYVYVYFCSKEHEELYNMKTWGKKNP